MTGKCFCSSKLGFTSGPEGGYFQKWPNEDVTEGATAVEKINS